MQYFYDAQIRRFILQFIRYFTQFQVEYGRDSNNNPIYYTVPVRYADTNKEVSALLVNNSENAMRSIPMMVAYIDALKYNRDLISDPTFTEKKVIRERATDPNTGELKTYQKNVITVERHMPVPYKLTLKLDIVTRSMEHKLQLIEQIAPLFNPSREIQNSDNYIDWTSLSVVTLTDLNFTSRTIPIGTDDPLDIATFTFDLPIYIATPAIVKKLNAVSSIVASIFDAHGNLAQAIEDQYELLGNRQWFTPSGYDIVVYKDSITDTYNVVLSKANVDNGLADIPTVISEPVPWRGVINYIGEITNGISQMAFVNEVNGNTVIGTISYHPTDPNILLFNIDPATIPSNTLDPIINIIDPLKVGPGAGLPAAAAGQRYLIINNNIGNENNNPANHPVAWRNSDNSAFYAKANDIIEYDGNNWSIQFDSNTANSVEYVTNLYSGVQLKWVDGQWLKSWEGLYREGLWLLII